MKLHDRTTTFVIGAGASAEFYLPVGNELVWEIRKLVNVNLDSFSGKGKPRLAYAIQSLANSSRRANFSYQEACNQIYKAMPGAESIDAFIHMRKDNPDIAAVGKIAIVTTILEAEAQSALALTKKDEVRDPEYISGTWITKLARLIFAGCDCDRNNLVERTKNLSFVVFNYDRCLEHFFCRFLMDRYAFSVDDAAHVVNQMNIHHPYGIAGHLPWEKKDTAVPFGRTPLGGDSLFEISKEIQTYTEQMEATESLEEIRNAISQAQRVFFLGFAFHQQNLELIQPVGRNQTAAIYATAFEESEPNRQSIAARISPKFGHPQKLTLFNGNCTRLFDDYQYELGG